MGHEEARIPGVVASIIFGVAATGGYQLMPSGYELAWLCLFGCSILTFFASFKQPIK